MFNDELLRDVERMLGKDLPGILRDTLLHTGDIPLPKRPAPFEKTPGGLSKWSSADFITSLRHHGFSGTYPDELPDQIDLSNFKKPITRLLALMQGDGLEHGRFGVVSLSKDSVILQETSKGTETGVTLRERPTLVDRVVICLHTHPSSRDEAPTHSYHFSPRDLAGFLERSSSQATIVIADGLTLLAHRTAATPGFDGNLERRLELLCTQFENDPTIPLPLRPLRFTKEACRRLSLDLYIHKHSQSNYIANRVTTNKN